MSGSHDRIIAEAARSALAPIGFKRKGRSRIWLADRGWRLNVVEFQPSAWTKGCYLNVAVHWLWSDLGHLSFDYGGRLPGFEEYESDEQFAAASARLSALAAAEAAQFDRLFSSVTSAADTLSSAEDGWAAYNAGIVAGLACRWELAAELFDRAIAGAVIPSNLLTPAAEQMGELVKKPAAFQTAIQERIDRHREAFGLPAWLLSTEPI